MPNPLHDPRYAKLRALLVAERECQDLTQVDVATKLGKPQSYVSKYERGERRLDVIELILVARSLNSDPLSFIEELLARL